MARTVVQAKCLFTVISTSFVLLKALTIRKWKVLDAFSHRFLASDVAAVVQTTFQTAILAVKSVCCTVFVLARAFASGGVALSVLTTVQAVLNFNSVDVYKTQGIRAHPFVACSPPPAEVAGTPASLATAVVTAVLIPQLRLVQVNALFAPGSF